MTTPTTTAEHFREALASFPSGVTVVTTTDADGKWWGFTATSFCAVSADPPLVLVCLANSAECYPVFAEASHWRIHIVHSAHSELAVRFATRGADKFGGGGFVADDFGLPHHRDACATLRCAAYARHPGGDHLILIGRVEEATTEVDMTPTVYYRRRFRLLQQE